MQIVSKEFSNSIRNARDIRDRGYIKVYIGIINQKAQESVRVDKDNCKLLYFSNDDFPPDLSTIKQYATYEKDFSHVDGSMYFPPKEENARLLYDNGVVSKDLLGNIAVFFGDVIGFEIKGLTINFGECYPTEFEVEYDGGVNRYTNSEPIWSTEDVFRHVSFFNIKPIKMVNEYGRLRIFAFICGLAKNYTNKEVTRCQFKEYVSPISETIASQDLILEIDNRKQYFDVDDENSAIGFIETGQEVNVSYGYEVDNTGKIEWIPAQKCFMSSWSATDDTVKFQATDRFVLMEGVYYKGIYREQGISLYDLAIDVLHDAGLEDEEEYFVDPYLKNVTVYNPMPAVMHKEALQIIANAGRCRLYQNRDGKICIKNDFIPEKTIETNDIAEFSKIETVLKSDEKKAYAMYSNDFSIVDGSVYFLPKNPPYFYIGYVSKSVSDSQGVFKTNPKITLKFEASFTCFGLMIKFRNVAPEQFVIRTYYQEAQTNTITVNEPQIDCIVQDMLYEFDKMEIEFTKGYPNARITLDNILLGDYTNYHLSNDYMHKQTERERKTRIREIVLDTMDLTSSGEEKELVNSTIFLEKGNKEYVAYFNEPSYGFKASVENNPQITCRVEESSAYYAKIVFDGVQGDTSIELKVIGYEYTQNAKKYVVRHNEYGETIEWNNPLISSNMKVEKLEKWLSSYLLGSVGYDIDWWGDPTTDAGDLFYFLTKKGNEVLIKSYENDLEFKSGGLNWTGKMKARRVVLDD